MGYYKSALERYLKSCGVSEDIAARFQYQKEQIANSINAQREREKLIDEIAREVLANIHTTLDTKQAEEALKQIKKRLDDLFKR